MATEKTLEILKKMKADPKAKELFEGMEKPKSPDEAISAYAQIAEKLGYVITADDVKEAVKQEESRRKANTDKVMARNDASEFLPFVWCRNKGRDWYLPAIEELELLLLIDEVYDAVEQTLTQKGATSLSFKEDDDLLGPTYWSSTDDDECRAWTVDLNYSGRETPHLDDKCFDYYVRAVAAF